MSALLSNGTATITKSVLAQLRSKHPQRTNPITRPRPPTRNTQCKTRMKTTTTRICPSHPPDPSDSDCSPILTRISGAHETNPYNDHRGSRESINMDIDLGNPTTDPGLIAKIEMGE